MNIIIKKNKQNSRNSITIKKIEQLMKLNPNKVQNITSFYFENLIIDGKFLMLLNKLSLTELDSFYFIECEFYELNVLSAITYCKNLGFVKCGLTLDEIKVMLDWIKDWKIMDTLDLSGNLLGKKPIEFFKYLNWEIWWNILIKQFNISDNGFSAEFKVRMQEHNEWFENFLDIVQ